MIGQYFLDTGKMPSRPWTVSPSGSREPSALDCWVRVWAKLVFISFKNNKITNILGVNGAGKTTTFKMLTGETKTHFLKLDLETK